MSIARLWVFGLCVMGVAASLGCGSSKTTKQACPADAGVNVPLACKCKSGETGLQVCQKDMTLSACVCADGGGSIANAGTSGGTTDAAINSGTGVGADGGSKPGTSGGTTDDGGTANAGSGGSSGGAGAGGTGGGTPTKAATDGTQLASCKISTDCTDSRVCYTASGVVTTGGYCTGACTTAADCSSLGTGYTCYAPAGGGAHQCRLACTGTSDTSCPSLMTCQSVAGNYRCLYPPKALGAGNVAEFQACSGDGDCAGDLVCYGIGTIMVGPTSYQGFCTHACKKDTDCTANPADGDVKTSCGTGASESGQCRLDCAGTGGLGGSKKCPTGMACAPTGLNSQRCLYTK